MATEATAEDVERNLREMMLTGFLMSLRELIVTDSKKALTVIDDVLSGSGGR